MRQPKGTQRGLLRVVSPKVRFLFINCIMARPIKKNAEFFKHDADMRNDLKVKALRRKFGHTGYAVWCFILETLTDCDFFELDYGAVNQELLAADYEVQADDLRAIVEYCCQIGLLQQSNDGERLYSEALKRRLEVLTSKRERDRERQQRVTSERKQEEKAVSEAKTDNIASSRGDNSQKRKEEKREEKIREEKKIVYPYQDIIDLWNSLCSSLPKVQKLTDDRRQKIKLRLHEFSGDPEKWLPMTRELFERVAASDFLNGDSGSGWTASFDWLFTNSKNWVKVTEGNYDNERGSRSVSADVAGVRLGVGEFIDSATKRRSYGSGKADIPMSAPPRPSERHAWNASLQQWTLL